MCNQIGAVFAVISSKIALAWSSGMKTDFETKYMENKHVLIVIMMILIYYDIINILD